MAEKSLLSNTVIRRYLEEGLIVIEPFIDENLGTVSYDVRLGKWFWREQAPDPGFTTYSPWSEKDVRKVWGTRPEEATPAQAWMADHGVLEGINSDDLIVWVAPGETILAHTEEFIGGRGGRVTTMMKARSSMGRNFIAVCKCAGWGDVGYVNRWTMEITNASRHHHIPLVAGRRIAQIAFFEVDPIEDRGYAATGKYQGDDDVEVLKAKWTPELMLPQMFRDREVHR